MTTSPSEDDALRIAARNLIALEDANKGQPGGGRKGLPNLRTRRKRALEDLRAALSQTATDHLNGAGKPIPTQDHAGDVNEMISVEAVRQFNKLSDAMVDELNSHAPHMTGTTVIPKATVAQAADLIEALREALKRAAEGFRVYAKSAEGQYAMRLEIAEGLRIQADLVDATLAETPITAPQWPRGQHVSIEHDGFSGVVIGHYERLDGKRGVVLQQDGTKVVHVYGERWLVVSPGA